jgi:hypothetical protein
VHAPGAELIVRVAQNRELDNDDIALSAQIDFVAKGGFHRVDILLTLSHRPRIGRSNAMLNPDEDG